MGRERSEADTDRPSEAPAGTTPAAGASGPLLAGPLTPHAVLALQRTAGNAAVARMLAGGQTGPAPRYIARHPAEKVLKFAGKWLGKRAFKQVSKHIAKHGRRIGGKALHSIFKRPNDIRWLLERTVAEAEQVAARNSRKAATEIIEEAGVRIERQAMGPGKWRLKVEKTFKSAIGTKGETVLRVIIDQSGRIVTAFPAERVAAVGLGVAGALALEEGTAQAAEAVHADAEEQARRDQAREDSWGDWEEWIPFLGDIWGGSLNEGEDALLRQQRFYADAVEDVIKRVEYGEQRSIGGAERAELEALVRAGVAAPYMMEPEEE